MSRKTLLDVMDLSFYDDCNRGIVEEKACVFLVWHSNSLLVHNLKNFNVFYCIESVSIFTVACDESSTLHFAQEPYTHGRCRGRGILL